MTSMLDDFAKTPEPPYYAVIFTSRRTVGDDGYSAMMEVVTKHAVEHPGFLGRESVRRPDGFGVTVIYYKDKAAVEAWRNHTTHRVAQEVGKQRWYERYEMRLARVESAYSGPEGR